MRAALALACLIAAPAFAQDRPPLQPTRDVSVTYRLVGGSPGAPQGQEMRMSWLTGEGKMRVDMPGGIGWSVVDQKAQKVFVVMEAQRMVMDVPMEGAAMPSQPPASARFTRGGSETIAGQSCTVWKYEDGGNTGEACLTADGVMLRSTGTHAGQSGSVEATNVAYGTQDPARFRPPAGYQPMQLPPGMAAPAGRPPAR
ncbi:DUF4412 domain-containing protein [Belnapia sp. T6]|uniref:DUF4412 domain-containing protein n=1 Tax=Belnapia mucosa TaxID=2804532 RepID=A0ABS1V2Y5_9PROT|nr:DUF4412 domain-containing protein [Belnapia mucosa]MBL6456062.1 DUF4412 domain-containing protein [Belnapia mucosa]